MTRQAKSLYLQEELMLLALRDEKGTIEAGSMYLYAIGGAILAELLLAGRIEIQGGRKKLVNLKSDRPLGEPVIDAALKKIATARRRANVQAWVQRISSMRNLKHNVAAGLCDRGILRAKEGKVLLVFSRTIYPEIDPRPERQLIERLRKAIFGDSPRCDPRTAILVSLANSTGLLRIPFERKELRKRKKRIEQLANGDLMGKAAADAIQAAQAAAFVACIMPAVTVTTMSH